MKIKYLLFVLIVFSAFLVVSQMIQKESQLLLISSPKVYSMKHTELNETFKISVLMNQNNSYHLEPNYIRKSVLISGENQLPIAIEKTIVSEEQMLVEDVSYYLVSFVVSLKFEMSDHIIEYEDVMLELTYENSQVINIDVGEFNYVFTENKNDLSMYNLHGTFGEVEGVNTVTGLVLELYNKSSNNLSIQRVDILSSDVSLNNDFLIEKDREIDMFEEVQDVLLTNTYQFDTYESTEHHHSILEGQTKKFYIPLLYNQEIRHISRFVIQITYMIDGSEEIHYIDDFVFMNSIQYGPEYEKNYIFYEYESN